MRLSCKCLFSALLIYFISLSYAQAPDTQWTRTYGGAHGDNGLSVKPTLDNGYIIVGTTMSFSVGGFDVYLIKTDSSGNIEWSRSYGGPEDDIGNCVVLTSDGGYLIVGYTYSYGSGLSDLYLIRTDSLGDTLWTKTYGGTYYDAGTCGLQAPAGEFTITGYTQPNSIIYNDVWLVRTDSLGDTLWTKIYDFYYEDWGNSIIQTTDGGYVIAGGTYWYMGYDVLVVKTDINGDLQWAYRYGGGNHDLGNCVCQTTTQEFIVAGSTWSYGAGDDDVYLLKIGSQGDTLWTKTYGDTMTDIGLSIQGTSDNGCIVVGGTRTETTGGDIYIIRTNMDGVPLWMRTYGGSGNERAQSVELTSDGGYIIVGYTTSYGAGDSDVWLLKMAPDTFGVEEQEVYRFMDNDLGATIFSGPLLLPEGKKCRVFDITGRVAIARNIKPGVYLIEIDNRIVQKVIKLR